MKRLFSIMFFILFFSNYDNATCQEWRSLRKYKKVTGKNTLSEGCWLKKDRKKKTERWKQANLYNLSATDGYLKYKTISQIRDFYYWFDSERKKIGHEIVSVGAMAIVAKQFSYFENCFIRIFIVRNKEIIWFGNESSKSVLKYYFPLLKNVLWGKKILKGEKAKEWDTNNTRVEQCQIVETFYEKLSPKVICKLEYMAKGKGIFFLGVKKDLRFEGDIRNCQSRYKHAEEKLRRYYHKQHYSQR